MSARRFAANVDKSQKEIVRQLIEMGATVEPGHDDILVGFMGLTFWFEIKTPSTKARTPMKPRGFSMRKTEEKQQALRDRWRGQLDKVCTFEQCREIIRERLTTLEHSIRLMSARDADPPPQPRSSLPA